LSQSATSHALDRLRKLLGDQLFVRTPLGMEPTPRALSLAGPLRLALQEIQAALAPESFHPIDAEGGFTIGVETYETIIVLPQLVQIRKEAPKIEITVRSGSSEEILTAVDRGGFDLAIGLFRDLPDRFMTCHLLTDDHVCVMRADHPQAQAPLTMEAYLAASHLLLSMSGASTDVVDVALAQRNLARRIVMRLPHGLAAVIALARSEMLASITRGAAAMFEQSAPLAHVDLPFPVPASEFRLVWNRRLHGSPAHTWLRRKLVAIAADAQSLPDELLR
jgi:DNA-binding transcriptional LysR family regulator